VAEALLVSDADIRPVADAETMPLRGETLPLCRLSTYFGVDRTEPVQGESHVVVATIGQRRLGLQVDTLLGQQDVVIKPLGETLGTGRCFSGATDIGDERLALVIDAGTIIDDYFSKGYGDDSQPDDGLRIS
jgi:two-component system chemotaxis sensor kinase CheA